MTQLKVRVWGLYKQRIPHDNIIEDWITLSWAAKWLDKPEMMSDILTPDECIKRDDKRILESVWKLIDEADIIVAHNLKKFDIRKLNSRFLINRFMPPAPYGMIDTLIESQKTFAHSSHRLDYLGRLIRNEGKISTDYGLWVRCENGEQQALDYMIKYNREDVTLLEEVYLWMRPWIKAHPNMGVFMELDKPVCRVCGSKNIVSNGSYYTVAGKYRSVRCADCGAVGRMRTNELTNELRKQLVRPIA